MTDRAVEAYVSLVSVVKELGPLIDAAVAVRYEPSPAYHPSPPSSGIVDPTLDTVCDPRRDAVSESLRAVTRDLRVATSHLQNRASGIRSAVDSWGGGPRG